MFKPIFGLMFFSPDAKIQNPQPFAGFRRVLTAVIGDMAEIFGCAGCPNVSLEDLDDLVVLLFNLNGSEWWFS